VSATPSPNHRFHETDFSYATLEFAEKVATDLIAAAARARPQWEALLRHSPGFAESIQKRVEAREALFQDPVVRAFTDEWCNKLSWTIVHCDADCYQLLFPPGLTDKLKAASNIASVSFWIGDLRKVACAELGTDDHHLNARLALNAPAWFPIATHPSYVNTFERQLRMVVHHELAHFRWHKSGIRDEYMAHARGVAALRDVEWPKAQSDIVRLLESEYKEAWANDEIRAMVSTPAGCRLVRFWGWRRRRMLGLA
jgi:hypothetical protein